MAKESIYSSFKAAYKVFPREYKIRFWCSLILLFFHSILELVGLAAILPLFLLLLKDNYLQESPFLLKFYYVLGFDGENSFAIFLCIAMFMIIIIKNILSTLIISYQTRFSFSLYSYFSTKLQKYYYNKGFLNLKKSNSNFLVSYINNHPSWFAQFFILPLLTLINEFTVIFLLILGILLYSPVIVLLLMCTVFPLSALIYFFIRKKINGVGIKKAKYGALLHKHIHQSIEGFVDVKTLAKENYFFNLYKRLVDENSQLSIQSNILMTIPSKVIETGLMLGIICLLLFGLFFGDKKELSTLLGLFAIAAYRILPSVNRMTAALLSIREHQYTVKIITKVDPNFDLKTSEEENIIPLEFRNLISIQNLSYGYSENEKILKNISCEIKKGETIGVIGKSGSGKTTFINILLRFLKENEGHISIDDVILTDKNVREWRQLIGYVQQNVYIIDGTLSENIAFGVPPEEVDKQLMLYAIESSSLSDLVLKLPNGIHTHIGERGSQISGGQRQRVGIARALYSKAKILFFDEATSSLDMETETEVTESIKELSAKNLTMLIIAHRYTTLRYCDRIFELDNGRISGIYSYQDLTHKMYS
jgi:ATP-binding cassette, subfamily B, bacterial PglK